MSYNQKRIPDEETLNQIAGITGVIWTASLLGYVISFVDVEDAVIGDPHSFLYVGAFFFVVTVGLDRMTNTSKKVE